MSKEVPTVPGHITLEEYGAEVLRTGRRVHLVVSDDRLVGMMNVHTLNSIPREEWAHNSVQAAMIPREENSLDLAGRAPPAFARAALERRRQSDARGERFHRRRATNRRHRHARLHTACDADALRTRPASRTR